MHRARVLFDHVSGLPEDRVSNGFTFEWTAGGAANYGALTDELAAMYNVDSGAGQASPIHEYLSSELSRAVNGVEITVTEMPTVAGPLGSPDYSEFYTLGAVAGGTQLPGEVASVLSWHGDLSTIPEEAPGPIFRPRARRRNRTFIGPLMSTTLDSSTGVARVAATFRTDMVAAFKEMWASASSAGWQLRAWSQSGWSAVPVVAGFIDNAFDTQRRRGPDASTRTNFTLP